MSDGQFRIMLADNKLGDFPRDQQLAEISRLNLWPLLVSPKMDGIRAVVRGGQVLSRKLIPIPSRFAQDMFGHLEGMDGELTAGDPTSSTCYRDTFSACMTIGCTTPLQYNVFDLCDRSVYEGFVHRYAELKHWVDDQEPECVRLVPQTAVYGEVQAEKLEQEYLDEGYEGLILRATTGPYKYGRSTLKQGWMLKLKRFLDSEAEIIGFEELMRNGNEATTDALGYTKRSSHKMGLVPMDTLGALICRDPKCFPDVESFKIGVFKGFPKTELQEIWYRRGEYLGLWCKYKYVLYGAKDRPRHPRGVGFRHRIDR